MQLMDDLDNSRKIELRGWGKRERGGERGGRGGGERRKEGK
jgi:hypothetical protein